MAAVAHPSRSNIRRNSPLSGFALNGFSADAPMIKRIDVGDDSDSDDEPPPAIKFSKVTQALLADAGVPSSPVRQDHVELSRFNRSTSAGTAGLDTPSRAPGLKVIRRNSPPGSQDQKEMGGMQPRIVRLGSSQGSFSAKRSVSAAGSYSQRGARREPTPEAHANPELVTPAQPRAIRVATRSRAGSNASQDEHAHQVSSVSRTASRYALQAERDANEREDHGADLSRGASAHHGLENMTRYGTSTATRSRHPSADVVPPPGSQRVKRAPMTGTFLRSGPVRRGFRRRDSEENGSANEEGGSGASSQPSATSYTPQDRSMSQLDGARSRSGSVNTRATSIEPVSVHDFARQSQQSQESRPPSRRAPSYLTKGPAENDHRPLSRQNSQELLRSRAPSAEQYQVRRRPSIQQMTAAAAAPVHPQSRRPSIDNNQARPAIDQRPSRQVSSYNLATSRYASQKAQSDALEDQENMPPPTFRRNKDQEFKYLGKPTVSATSDDEKAKVEETPVPVSGHEQRNPLVSVSGNTPHRPAPAPPPKMSVLDAATSNAGASTTKIKKKRNHIIVKGKIFTQMGKIGKGGSSDVYCVMAENYKTFALKRVKLEDCDENAVRGYKGEIDLLKKLTEVERVVRLIDWELNDDKQELVVLMEKGDTDLARVLTMRLNEPDARFDSAFTRYHWREMLECVQAVHDYDIVHSDLKPANFLLVQGRLKLIDFGIANAIDIDHTINVHRDSHVGTPNYMSPESITDTNAHSNVKDDAGRPLKKDMRIGKSSDIWSLGCILYQMAYGRPPFAHIQNTYQRIMAITNRHHIIEFPNTGVGGSHIPSTLKGTLRKCLNRDPDRRPLIKDMLSDSDPYLNPEGIGNAVLMDEALLGQIINKVLERCRDPNKGIPPHEEAQAYPKSFMNKIRQMQEER